MNIVEITEEDITRGIRKNMQLCPIARAVKRKFPEAAVYVGLNFIDIDEFHYSLSEEISKFIWDFDKGIQVKPFTFDLDNLDLSQVFYAVH